MLFKKITSLFLFLLLIFQTAKSTTWITVADGFWNSPSVWSTGIVPPHFSSDTFHIDHHIELDSNLNFNSHSYIKIGTSGGICGHHTVNCLSGSSFLCYGILHSDSLNISGRADFYPPACVIITYRTFVHNGYLETHGNYFAVGPWFNCFTTCDQPMVVNDAKLLISPNPFISSAIISTNIPSGSKTNHQTAIIITDLFGNEIKSFSFEGKEFVLEKGEMRTGIYFIKVTTDNQPPITKRIVIQ